MILSEYVGISFVKNVSEVEVDMSLTGELERIGEKHPETPRTLAFLV